MNGITELAKLFKERENANGYSPMIGRIIRLPDLKIQLGDKVIVTSTRIKTCISLNAVDESGRYIHLGKEVVLLPYADSQKFILIGVVQ
ncbi:MAG: hypothetical protein Q8873_00100 [Bacillota bacterium]|nr:hypothetical protein [Bacillota bacterium]